MKDEDDVMVRDLIEDLEIDQKTAIKIMYHIRTNAYKYFVISQKET